MALYPMIGEVRGANESIRGLARGADRQNKRSEFCLSTIVRMADNIAFFCSNLKQKTENPKKPGGAL